MKNLIILILSLITLTSCEKVIDVDIRDTDTKVVIEGGISEGAGPHSIRVTRSANFDASGTGAVVNNATVTVRSSAGQTDTLRYSTGGNYLTRKIVGVPGQTYTLTVSLDGKSYVATSTMPKPIRLLEVTSEAAGPNGKAVMAVYDDPIDVKNYYRFLMTINDKRQEGVFVTDDRIRNGVRARTPVGLGPAAPSVKAGDRVQVEMQCIDGGVFDYFNSLASLLEGQSVSPANPNSNLSGGALGYFSAYTSSTNSATVR